MNEARLRAALAVLSVIGIGIATYLTIVHYQGGEPVCLAGGTAAPTCRSPTTRRWPASRSP